MKIASDRLSVEIAPLGAELQSVVDAEGRSWLWRGDPTLWAGRAPLLFPVVGRSPGGAVTIAGHEFPMGGHGFARTSSFEAVVASDDRLVFRLAPSEATRVHYPFAFQLDVDYAVDGDTLTTRVTVTNHDDRPMPASFGFHPAFVWPLPGAEGVPHRLRLDHAGAPPIRRLSADGLMKVAPEPSPFVAGELALDHDLFQGDAIVLDHDAGGSARFDAPGHPGVLVEWDGLPHLGIWTKLRAPYLCIEPWRGLPPEVGASSALEQRPGIVVIAPGEDWAATLRIAFGRRFD